MKWSEIRQQYPDQWLLLEAVKAHTEGNHRVIEELAVVDTFADSPDALRQYNEMHRAKPQRELYVFHTSRESLDVRERRWLGIRSGS